MIMQVLNVMNIAIITAVRFGDAADIIPTMPMKFAGPPHKPIPLVIGGFFPLSKCNQSGLGHAARIAANMALHDVRRSTVLRGYNLTMVIQDTQCKASVGTKAFFDMMNSTSKKLVLYGDACTEVNEPIAMTAKYWNMVQVSYAETHPKFSANDKQIKYPTFYKMAPANTVTHKAMYKFLQAFRWRKIGTLVQSDDPRRALPHERFINGFIQDEAGIVVATQGFSSNNLEEIDSHLDQLKQKDARIIFGHFDSKYAHSIFCEIYRKEMFGSHYTWIFMGFHSDMWWAHNKNSSCETDAFLQALQGHFIMEFIRTRNDSTPVSPGIRHPPVFYRNFRDACKLDKNCSLSHFASYAYDGIWTIALALNLIVTDYYAQTQQLFVPATTERTFTDLEWKRKLMHALDATNFEGVTGRLRFRFNERLGRIRIAQFRGKHYKNIGEYDGAENTFRLNNESIWWPGGKPPMDSTKVQEEYRYTNLTLFFAMCVLTGLGILVSITFLSINIHFRDHKFIKMSSPNLNNLIIIGSMLTYLSIVLIGIDTRIVSQEGFAVLCTAKSWVLCFGFTLAFGSMFSKTWRVHSIFTNIKLNKKAIKDYQLLLIVGVLLLVDSVIMGAWLIIDPLFRDEKALPPERDPLMNLEIHPIVEFCNSRYSTTFQAIMFGYKGLLLVLGVFLAWETRNVNVPALNDSKFIGMSVYNVVIMCSIGVALSFILQDKVNESYVLSSFFILFCTTLTLCLVFVPKLIELSRNPNASDKNYRRTWIKATKEKIETRSDIFPTDDTLKDKIHKAEQDNSVWKKILEEKSKEQVRLIGQLKELGDELELSDSAIENASSFADHSSQVTDSQDAFGGIYIGPSATPVPKPVPPTAAAQISAAKLSQTVPVTTVANELSPNATPLLHDTNERTSLLQQG